MTIYAAQFGKVWKLTEAEWKAIVAEGLQGYGYTLPGLCLERRPAFIQPNLDGRGFWISHPTHRLVQPLDWDADEFRYEAEEHFPELLTEEGV